MRTEAARKSQDDDLVAQLVRAGERLTESVTGPIVRRGREVIPALIAILEDGVLALADACGGGYAPIHAATILGMLDADEAIRPMLRVLARCDAMDILYSTLIHTLAARGARVLEPALAAHAVAESQDQREAIANVLSGLQVRDDRILPILLNVLDDDAGLGAGLLAEYGDPAALPHLSAALDDCELDARGGLLVNKEIIELVAAIEDLGGELTEQQRAKARAVEDARDEARAPLLAINASEADDEDECEREEVMARFAESPHAESASDLDWIELSLRYGTEYDGVSFSGFDARVLRDVLFELFPRKVSCDASAAEEIVRSVRAFWTFAKDVLAHPHAEACLRELGDEAIPKLARKLHDPSNFGMAKSMFMMGRSRGFDVESEEGLRKWFDVYNSEQTAPNAIRPLSARGKEDSKRKKKLRKLRRQAQRRNRR